MEPTIILLGIATCVATGSLAKIGENVTDAVSVWAKRLIARLKLISPCIAFTLENSAKDTIDYYQTYLKVDAISNEDTEIKNLLEEICILLDQAPKLREDLENEISKGVSKLPIEQQQVIFEKWNGINVKGGVNTFKDFTLNF
jgi:hypothetical protein